MKIKADVVPYSSVVGGGVLITDETGRAIGQVMFINHGAWVAKKENQSKLTRIIANAINAASDAGEFSDG